MVGPDWRQLFDVVIVQADKPSFFTDRRKYGPHWGDGAGAWEPAFAWYLGWGHPLVSTWPVEMVPARHHPPQSCPTLDIQPFTAPSPSRTRPFRKLDEKGSLHWDRITSLEKGKIYRQVSAMRVASPWPQVAEGAAARPPGPCRSPTRLPCLCPLALCPGAPGNNCEGPGLVRLPVLDFTAH